MSNNKRIFSFFVCLLICWTSVITSLASANESENFQPLNANKVKILATTVVNDKLATLYLDRGNVVYEGENKKFILAKGSPAQNVWLKSNGNTVYALWWTKEPEGKKLYLRSSPDNGKTFHPVVLISKGGVLPEVSFIEHAEENKMALAYVTEDYPGYQIYLNRTLDGGQNWLKEDIRINKFYDNENEITSFEDAKKKKPDVLIGSTALSPKLFYLDKKLVVIWEERAIRNTVPYLRIVSKISEDDGSTWSEEEDIYLEPNANPVELNATVAAGEIYVVAFVKDKGVLAFRSKESGVKWQSLYALPGTEKLLTASWFRLASTNERLLVSYVAQAPGLKDEVRLNSLSLEVGRWIEDEPLVFGKRFAGDGQFSTKSTFADLKALGDSSAIIAWEDYRYLMPIVMSSYFNDSDGKWSEPKAITTPGKTVSKFPSLFVGENQSWVLFTYFDAGSKDIGNNYLTSYQLLDEEKNVKLPKISQGKKLSKEKSLERLKVRAQSFWKSRLKENHKESWKYFDPLYRSLFNEAKWSNTQGKIIYLDAEIGEASIYGLLAEVKTKVSVSINNLLMGDDDLVESPPPKKVDMVDRWGWFYDDWYYMPETMFDRRYEY